MRIDPSHIGDPLNHLGGGAVDAAQGQDAQRQADEVKGEAAYEPLDSLLLKRMRVSMMEAAADTVGSFADAQSLLDQTRTLMGGDSAAARSANGELARDRLRDLLGDA